DLNLFNKNHSYIYSNKNIHIKSGYCHHAKEYQLVNSKEKFPGLKFENRNIHSTYYPIKEAKKLVERFEGDKDTVICFGFGLGYFLFPLMQKYQGNIIVIEPDKNLFNIALKNIDISNFTDVEFYVGFDDYELQNMINIDSFDIFEFKQRVDIYKEYFVMLKKRLLGKSIYDVKDKFRYKKFQSENLNIVYIDSSYVLTKEVVSALKQMNHNVKYLHIDKNDYDYTKFIKNILHLINSFKPDLILTINHLGFDKSGKLTELLTDLEIPYASWYVDSPSVILSSYEQNVSDFCNLFVWDKDYLDEVRKVGYNFVDYLPLATMPELFKPQNIPFKNDVSFVGSSMVFAIHKNMRSFIHRPDLLNIFEKVVIRFLEISSRKVADAINELKQDNYKISFDDEEQRKDFEAAVLWRATQKYRLSGIKQLAEFNLTLRGDPNWDRFVDDRYKLGREIWYYDDMPEFYNSSKINFNMTSLQMKYAVNQRVFDVPACQRFILTDYQEQLEEIFEVGKDIICFNDIEEIPDLVKYYLKNPAKRNEIAMRGYQKIIDSHTYIHRLTKLIQVVKKNYNSII
ncbi:MAG: glycosyltransferase, partial [Candidatus Cloacimonadota bacterium]|nr:glycosyltransferase [Candidatus Cloacimonadota bacterium]